MNNETVFLRFKGVFYNNPADDFITMYLPDSKIIKKPKEYKVPKSAILFYVPGKKSIDDEILLSLSNEDIKKIGFPKFKKLRPGTKGTENLPPRPPSVPPKIEFFLEGFVVM